MAENSAKTIDPKSITPPPSVTGGRSVKPVQVDIFNCTQARRVVWNGLMPVGAHILVEPGETKYDATLAEWVVKELRASHRADSKREVRVFDAGKAPKPDAEATGDEDADDGE